MRPGLRALGVIISVAAALPTLASADLSKINTRAGFVDAVTGKSLTLGRYGINLRVLGDGRVRGRAVGRDVSGDWAWKDGYFCRTLFWGKREIPYNCQRVDYDGDTIRFTSDRGSGRSADFQLR